MRVSGNDSRQHQNVNFTPIGKSPGHPYLVQDLIEPRQGVDKGPSQNYRETVCHGPSNLSCPSEIEISSAGLDSGPVPELKLRGPYHIVTIFDSGDQMVVDKHPDSEGLPHEHSSAGNGYLYGCIDLSGLGAHMKGGPSTGGRWSQEERGLHINILELLAVEIAIKIFLRI